MGEGLVSVMRLSERSEVTRRANPNLNCCFLSVALALCASQRRGKSLPIFLNLSLSNQEVVSPFGITSLIAQILSHNLDDWRGLAVGV